ncbi:chymotrypsinogen A [Biomphalaria pfeifferi]|uniref:Acrosin n=1 Tax=Biomphalaria pfeifferi TaxID=112525 RepID=A0AAD8ATX4_BIOPF|nr:chymotrypsinogen A [Biomphalaria pfeifferi]
MKYTLLTHMLTALTTLAQIRSCQGVCERDSSILIKRPLVELDSYRKIYLRLRSPTKRGRVWKETAVPKSPESMSIFAEQCGVPKIETSMTILNGSDAPERSWPWQVLIKGEQKLCSGVVISDRWVLTAAHCFNKTENIVMGFTDLDKWRLGAQYRTAALEVIHRNYQASLKEGDIGLIMLNKPVAFNDYIRPICILKSSPRDFIYPEVCYVTGWGVHILTEKKIYNKMQQLKVQIMPHSSCRLLWSLRGIVIHSGHVCLEFNSTAHSAGVCSGDSGGPLSCKIQGKYYLLGLASFVEKGCVRSFTPDVYTRVSDYLDWIKETITKYS